MNREHIIDTSDKNQTLQQWLKKQFPYVPFAQWQKWLRTGQIRCDGKRAKGPEILTEGQKVRIPPMVANFQSTSPDKPLVGHLTYTPSNSELDHFKSTILFENDEILVINKPAGLAVQGGSNIHKHVDGLVRALYPQHSPKLVHRLDRETSGVLLLAKNLEVAQKLTKAFAVHSIQKEYWAITEGIPPKANGTILTHLEKGWSKDMEKMKVSSTSEDAKPSETSFKVLAKSTSTKKAFLSLIAHTGRTHQLRVHCEHIRCPILGDRKYNPKSESRQLHLHARQLLLPPELGGHIFTAELPGYFKTSLDKFRLMRSSN